MDISVVIPVYGCRAAIPELYRRLTKSLLTITDDYEIILVEDCCPQNSWEEIGKLCKHDKKVKGLHFSRNFGQIKAITAGLDYSQGDWVVVMDCDLQDRPESIPLMYEEAQKGFDVVFARRENRKDSFITKILSGMFYKLYDYFTDGIFDSAICNFSISRRIVIDAYCRMREQNRAYTMFIRWLGFKQTAIDMTADQRFEGKSSYNLKKKLKLAFEIITSQSNKPLYFSIKTGFLIATLAFFYILYLIFRYVVRGDFQSGWPTIVASVYLMGGLILSAVGVAGIYIGNIFNEVKQRPLYIVRESYNLDCDKTEDNVQ